MKCPSCEAEWQSGKSLSVIESCPFCGASLVKKETKETECIEDVLYSLIEKHGKDLYKKENSSRLKSFLSDFAVKFPKERKFLNVVIDEGIQEKLLNIDNGTNDEKHYVIVSCCLKLTEDIGFSENRATEAVNILATGLGWKIPLSQYVVDQKQDLSATSTIDSIYQQLIELKQEISEISTIEVSDSLGETSPLEKKDDKYDVQNAYLEKQTVLSPIGGTIFRYLVKEGSDVSPDTKILTVMSMGVEFEIEAGYSGKVHFITPICSRINNGQPIARIEKLNLFDENLITKSAAKPIIPKTFGNTTQTNNQWQNTQTSETSEEIKTSVANTLLDDKINIGQTVATIQDENITNENLNRQTKEKSIETVEKPKQKKLFLGAVLIINFILTILISFHFIWERQGFEDIEGFISLMAGSVTPSFTFLVMFFFDPWFKLAFMKGSIPDILDFSPNSYDIGIRMEKSIKMLTIIMEIFNLFYLVLLIYFDLNNRTLKMKEFMVLIFIWAVQWVSVFIYFRISHILSEYDLPLDKKINSIK